MAAGLVGGTPKRSATPHRQWVRRSVEGAPPSLTSRRTTRQEKGWTKCEERSSRMSQLHMRYRGNRQNHESGSKPSIPSLRRRRKDKIKEEQIEKRGKNLSRSYHKGYSHTYNSRIMLSRLQRIYHTLNATYYPLK